MRRVPMSVIHRYVGLLNLACDWRCVRRQTVRNESAQIVKQAPFQCSLNK